MPIEQRTNDHNDLRNIRKKLMIEPLECHKNPGSSKSRDSWVLTFPPALSAPIGLLKKNLSEDERWIQYNHYYKTNLRQCKLSQNTRMTNSNVKVVSVSCFNEYRRTVLIYKSSDNETEYVIFIQTIVILIVCVVTLLE